MITPSTGDNGKQMLTLLFGQKGHVAGINRSFDAGVLRQRDARIYVSYTTISAIRLNQRWSNCDDC